MTTEALLFALGCSDAPPCPVPDDVCNDETGCPELALDTPPSPPDVDVDAPAADVALLATQDERRPGPSDAQIHCEARPDPNDASKKTWNFVRADGVALGLGWPTEDACKAQIRVENGFVCASSGPSFAPYNVATGAVMAVRPRLWSGTTMDACWEMVRTYKDGLLCAWTGFGYAPFNASTGALIGGVQQSNVLDTCVEKLVQDRGRVCSWDDDAKKPAVFTIDGTNQTATFGVFDTQAECAGYLPRYDHVEDANARLFPASGIDLTSAGAYTKYLVPWSQTPVTAGFDAYKACVNPKNDGHLNTDARVSAGHYEIVPQCRFDTLYLWSPKNKLDWFTRNMGPGVTSWPHGFFDDAHRPRPLFSTTSPSSSFGYGDYPMRLKIKPGVVYRSIEDELLKLDASADCSSWIPESEWDHTILVRYFTNSIGGSGLDYILCGAGPIESWSYSTQNHYDEVVRDLLWQSTHAPTEYANYYKIQGKPQLFDLTLDQHEFSRDVMKDRLMRLLRDSRVAQPATNLFVNPDLRVAADDDHFKSRFPVYYRP
jgi:hypothetical protein